MRIWTADLEAVADPQLAELEALLADAERARAARFHFARDRQHYVAARGLLRKILGASLEMPPASVKFHYGVRGKPALAQAHATDPRLRFNLSHSGGWAMIALAWDREVGIDLESTTRLAADDEHLSALAARVLSEREFEIWRALPSTAIRHGAFLRAWTRKEAYAKATGEGVFDGLREIDVILDAATPASSVNVMGSPALSPNGWTLHDLPAPDGFAAALALARP